MIRFTLYIMVVLLLMPVAFVQADQEPDLATARWQAVHRQRRIIYNNDGDDITGGVRVTPDEYLSRRMEHLAGTQVDSIFWSPGVTTVVTFPSRVAETYDKLIPDTVKPPQRPALARDNVRGFRQAGRDPLTMTVDFCHQNDMELFLSHRMNDSHDAHVLPWEFSHFKRDHPSCLFGRKGDNHRFGMESPRFVWSGLDYEIPDVRDYIFRILEDACQRYDLDGLELDWLKVPMFFRPTLDRKPVQAKHVGIMNDFVRRVRAMTRRVEKQRGRPLLLCCRVPRTVRHGLAVGLDLTTWLKQDLVDMLTVGGGYVPMAMASEVQELSVLAHQYAVPVYPCISNSGMQRGLSSVEAWRGAAMNSWRAGADGIYIFNFFPETANPRFSQLGSLETLKGKDKIYAVDCWTAVFGWHTKALCLDGRLPVELPNDRPVRVWLPVGENIVANAPSGESINARIRLRMRRLSSDDQVTVRLNGQPLQAVSASKSSAGQPATRWVEFPTDPAFVRPGDNLVDVQLTTARTQPALLDRLLLSVSYQR